MPADRAILFRLATSARLESAVRAAPPGERLAWRAASRYVAGTTAVAAARAGHRNCRAGRCHLPCAGRSGQRPAYDLVARGIPARVYVPFDNDWFRYWMRRLAESRGA